MRKSKKDNLSASLMEKRVEINHSVFKTPKKPQKAAGALPVLSF